MKSAKKNVRLVANAGSNSAKSLRERARITEKFSVKFTAFQDSVQILSLGSVADLTAINLYLP